MSTKIILRRELENFITFYFNGRPAEIEPMVGDAGFRNYFRIRNADSSWVLMDCPTSYCSTRPFIEIARYLKEHNFSAPEILAEDIDNGFLLLEDFGDLSLKKYLENLNEVSRIRQTYFLLVDLLLSLQAKIPPDNLIHYSNDILLSELELFIRWYVPYKTGAELAETELKQFASIWNKILSSQARVPDCLLLRDYHAENIMYLADRDGIRALGILDFQDALIGSPVYDLVSVLQDARIMVAQELELECIEYFAARKKLPLDTVLLNYNILGAQRNSRILGVFTRKAVRDGAGRYLQYVPLVVKYLERNLSHPALLELKLWIENILGSKTS